MIQRSNSLLQAFERGVQEPHIEVPIPGKKKGHAAHAVHRKEAVKKARPASMKGIYIKRITLTSTMGPGIKIDPNGAQSMEITE